ncbi:interaptin-like [Agrilus planipennis]|uniref:Interaptin-like n=1 Tax=Agrilus planipennis TaxID=224129 RepID=A0A1W4XRY7_AGRPL|nr:interaptin-like [Agrilus planipennis]
MHFSNSGVTDNCCQVILLASYFFVLFFLTYTLSKMNAASDKKVLDGEFRKILAIIKPFIPCVTNNHYLMMYRIWLEKLSDVDDIEKLERNRYLTELCSQIQAGVLEEPFTEMPFDGILLPFDKMLQFAKFQTLTRCSNADDNFTLTFDNNCQIENQLNKLEEISSNTNQINSDIKSMVTNNENTFKSHEESLNVNHDEMIKEYLQNNKTNALKRSGNSKKRKAKLSMKLSSSKLINRNYHHGHHKQKSIYVVQKEVHTKPQTTVNFNLESVPEEQNYSSIKSIEDTAVQVQNQTFYREYPVNQYFHQPVPLMNSSYDNTNITSCEEYAVIRSNEIEKLIEKYQINEEASPQNQNCNFLNEYIENCEQRCSPRQQHVLQNFPMENQHLQMMAENEESSWCDLSEGTSCTAKIGSGDGAGDTQNNLKLALKSHYNQVHDSELKENVTQIYENRISDMNEIINSLKHENAILHEQVENYENQIKMKNKKAETSIHNLSTEVTSLKERLRELSSSRGMTRRGDIDKASKWKHSIIALKSKYESVLNKNEELKDTIEKLKLKIEEMDNAKEKELLDLKEKLTETHKKEIESLRNSHSLHLKELDNSFSKKIFLKDQECKDRIEEMRTEYDSNEAELKENFQKELELKDAEIIRLDTMIQEQCLRMQKEVKLIRNQMERNAHLVNGDSLDKILFLQKCIFKMEKLFKKSQRDYAKQVASLKNELAIKNRTFEIRLTKQRTELIKNSTCINKTEIDSLITDLEERYRVLLDSQQTQALIEKEKDMRTISELRTRLAKLQAEKN